MTSTFAVDHLILSPQALALQVLPRFGVRGPACVQFFQAGFNDTYRVDAEDGVYFLRVYRHGWRTRDDALYELDVLDHLRSKGVAVAHPLPTLDGSLLEDVAAPEGPRGAALFVLAQGRGLEYGTDPVPVARRYGEAVAAMHDALDDFQSPHRRFELDLGHLIDEPLGHIEAFASRCTEDWSYLRRFAAAVKREIASLPEAGLERGVCHGDLQCYHAHLDDEGVLTFYDFDCGGYGYRAYDLAVFRWCARLESQEDSRWPAFLSAYRQARPFNELDVRAVPLFVCARHIWHMGVHAENASHWGSGDLNADYYGRRIQALRSLAADYGIRI